MEARNRITSRRALLPQDIQLIEAIGITPDEFYDFLDQCEYACEKRDEAYSHIPDVRNGLYQLLLVLTIVLYCGPGLGWCVAGPKPKSPDDSRPPQLQTGDKTGKTKFTLTTTSTLSRS